MGLMKKIGLSRGGAVGVGVGVGIGGEERTKRSFMPIYKHKEIQKEGGGQSRLFECYMCSF